MTSSIRDPHEDDQLLTMEEVSDVVRVPIATLRYWRHLGMGPHGFRVGRNVRYWRLVGLRETPHRWGLTASFAQHGDIAGRHLHLI